MLSFCTLFICLTVWPFVTDDEDLITKESVHVYRQESDVIKESDVIMESDVNILTESDIITESDVITVGAWCQ